MPAINPRWENTKSYLAQMTHFLGGALFVALSKEAGWEPWWGVLLVFVFMGIKELWMDTPALKFLPGAGFWEQDTLQGSLVDLIFWVVGAFIYRLVLATFWGGLAVGLLWITFMVLYYWVQGWTEYD